jgi:hypothetical protein
MATLLASLQMIRNACGAAFPLTGQRLFVSLAKSFNTIFYGHFSLCTQKESYKAIY